MSNLYFSLLPSELIPLIILNGYTSSDIISNVSELVKLDQFQYINSPDTLQDCDVTESEKKREKFWASLYRRDISSITPIPEKFSCVLYQLIIQSFENNNYFNTLRNCTTKGYDILLYPLLPTPKKSEEQRAYNNNLTYNYLLDAAAEGGHVSIIEHLVRMHIYDVEDYNMALNHAARYGHGEAVEKLVKLGANKYDGALHRAAYKNHINIVQRLIKLGAKDYNKVMRTSALNGRFVLVKMMLELGADDYDLSTQFAREEGHNDIIELIEQYRQKRIKETVLQ